jgi:hypothetical protein
VVSTQSTTRYQNEFFFFFFFGIKAIFQESWLLLLHLIQSIEKVTQKRHPPGARDSHGCAVAQGSTAR